MSETVLDRVPVSQAEADSGLSRSTFYGRLKAVGIVPLKMGGLSFLTKAARLSWELPTPKVELLML